MYTLHAYNTAEDPSKMKSIISTQIMGWQIRHDEVIDYEQKTWYYPRY